ncbi:hypothetical protein Tco_1427743 [Tanacetum coccineum]
MVVLNARNKLKLINGEFEELAINSPTRSLWERANDMEISRILNTISEQIRNNLSYISSTSALWSELDALEAPYACDNGRTNGERGKRKRLIQFLMCLGVFIGVKLSEMS